MIDGFQGSANSFATEAFKQSQTQYVKLAHHLHSPAQIIKAIEKDIPVLLTIREPEGTVLSLTSRWPYITVTQGLQSYIGFYAKLQDYAPHYVISTFKQTTQHLDCVVQKVNAKFGTHFDVVDVDIADAELKAKHSPESEVRRRALKQEKRKELAIEKNTFLLAQANELYQTFEGKAQHTVKL